MKKWIALALVLGCLTGLCGCGGAQPQQTATTLDLNALSVQMLEKMPADGLIPQLSEKKALNLYGVERADCTELLIYTDYDSTKCNELWLLCATDEAALERLEALAQKRIDSLLRQSENYNADVFAASEKARLETRGLYLMLCVTTAGNADEVAELFLNA